MTLFRKTLSFLKTTLPIAILIGCQNPVGKSAHGKGTPPRENGGGVVDGGGGGDFIYHSKEEVIKAIDEVWNQIIQKHPDNPILQLSWFTKKEFVEGNREQQEAFQILERVLSAGPPDFAKKDLIKDTEYITGKYPKLELNGMCRGPHDQSYLASVTRLERTGTICISVYGLMRTPSGALHSDLFGLFIHEIAHLNGYGEDEARAIQRFMLKNIFRVLFLASDEARVHFLNKYWNEITSHWPFLINYGPIDEIYLRQLSYSANLMLVYGIPQHVKRGAARNDLANEVRDAFTRFSENLGIFGEELYGRFLKAETSVDQLQLSRMRSLAIELIALDKLMTSYLVGSDPALLNRLISSRNLKREGILLNRLTEPEWLRADSKPLLICSEEDAPPNLDSLSGSEKFRLLGTRRRKVCEREFQRMWPDLYKLGGDNADSDPDAPVPTESSKQQP